MGRAPRRGRPGGPAPRVAVAVAAAATPLRTVPRAIAIAIALAPAMLAIGAGERSAHAAPGDPPSSPPAPSAPARDGAPPRDPRPSAERIRSAAAEFDDGRRLFLAGDFEQAAIHFENAFNDAPRAEPLRNAIRARRAAKQFARAATLAALAAARYPDDASTAALVKETLGDASKKLYVVKLGCTPECGVAVDQRVATLVDATHVDLYVDPGEHDVTVSWSGDRTRPVHVRGKPGEVQLIDVEAPPLPPPPPPPVVYVPPPPPKPKPLGPAVFFVGAGLTAIGVGATIFSGIDAVNHPGKDAVLHDCVGLGESCATYQEGRSAELRTNIALGATAAVGVATAVVGVFFTQWSAPAAPRPATGAAVGPIFDAGGRPAGLAVTGAY